MMAIRRRSIWRCRRFCQFEVKYTGKEAHASAFPELGINAADALVIAQSSIGPLRQHIHPTDRIHGIVTRRRSAKHRARTHLRELHGGGPHRR